MMDNILIEKYERLVASAKLILEIENKNWPSYIRSEFAELRQAVKEVDDRKKYIDETIRDLIGGKVFRKVDKVDSEPLDSIGE